MRWVCASLDPTYAAMAKEDDGRKRIAENRRARFDYHIEDTWEAGISLTGTEVKSLRAGQANIAESYAAAEKGGIFLINAYIPEYKQAGAFFQHNPRRPRRLLLHKKEIHRLTTAVDRQGMTMVPLELYFNKRGRVKLRLALAQGKKLHDKRETEARRDWQRAKARLMREKG
jgi:SsrA-binding protein